MKLFQTASAAAVLLLALTLSPSAQELPPGPGADIVAAKCSACHGIEQVTTQRKDKAGWSDSVTTMISNGADVSDANFDIVVNYLATNFGLTPAPAAASVTSPPAGGTAPGSTAPAK